MGRRFRGPLKKAKEVEIPEEAEQDEGASGKTDQKSNNGSVKQDEEEEEYYYEEEYPEDKYRQLEERMKAVEIQKVSGIDFEELRLISGVVIPPKFKTPTFAKYDGVSCPKLHLKSYSMSMGPRESFKEYVQKWRDLAGIVQPPLADTELVDMFMGTLTGPFYSYLLGSSSAGFTDLILTGERVKSGIRSGKIQMATSSGVTKKPYSGRTEANVVHGKKVRNKNDNSQSVGAVLISTPTPRPNQQQGYQRRQDAPRRNFTKINMPLSQALQYLLKASLITVRDPPRTTNTTAPETSNVITAPMPKHDKAVNVVDQDSYVTDVMSLTTPLPVIKKKLLQAGLFPGCVEDCYYRSSQSNGCVMLKTGIQRLMDNRTILFERMPSVENLCEDLAQNLKFKDVSVISKTPVRIPTKGPRRITSEPKVAPLIITKPGPIPYSSDKAVPWSYGNDVYIHGAGKGTIAGTSSDTS
ncbi:uncharacterized protein LOC131604592 [Vicia villosa]|uniref:uncharacterized protein LOC131604592 n=1 Tax=Vicia villosa TaxID=3911 RepID=UPI00273A8CB5|nr:uncharacterized protein LOC131604592 [Vicia villosa]